MPHVVRFYGMLKDLLSSMLQTKKQLNSRTFSPTPASLLDVSGANREYWWINEMY
jgi:hypothetical protein